MAIIISQGGKNAQKVKPSPFENEDNLQEYIYDNPDSIPLYEIDDDIKLLILAREFPTGSGPIDALGVDADGEIYLVETKLYKNPDKRTVVAQVLDYGASLWAAGGNYDKFKGFIEKQVTKAFGMDLNQKLKMFFGFETDTEVEALKDNLQANINKGNFRFVVLMDKLSNQLKDLIAFINTNSRFDIFAVELECYKHKDFEIIIPKLFGAEVKKDTAVAASGPRKKWNEVEFFEDAKRQLDENGFKAVCELHEFSKETADDIKWGTGKTDGSFNPVYHRFSPSKSLFTVTSSGGLAINFPSADQPQNVKHLVEQFKKELEKATTLRFKADYMRTYPMHPIERWCSCVPGIKQAIQNLLKNLEGR